MGVQAKQRGWVEERNEEGEGIERSYEVQRKGGSETGKGEEKEAKERE